MRHTPRRIVILSEHNLFREAMIELLRSAGISGCGQYADSRELLDATRQHPPDVLILDLDHQSDDTMALLRQLRSALPKTHLVVLGTAQRQGAANVSTLDGELETPSAGAAALTTVVAGMRRPRSPENRRQRQRWAIVTPRQRDVLRWLVTGIDNQAIASRLRVSERAVKAHVTALLEQFGLKNRTQLALMADHAGLRPPRARATLAQGER